MGSDFLNGAAYIRVSTDQQMELSPDSQLEEIKKYAKAHNILLTADYLFMEEEGRSGRKSANRPQFQRMIAAAKATPRPFDVILVWKFSRFARNQEESIVYKSMLRTKCGVEVISVSEPLVDGPFGSLIERIIEWMDEYYSIRLAGEVRRGMAEKAQRGGVVGSPAYGYRVENGIFVPYEPEAAVVRTVFEACANGEKLQQLARRLNAMGVRTKSGKPIANRTIERILQNPVYIGKIRWSTEGKVDTQNHGELILSDGHHQPIIAQDLFDLVQDRLRTRAQMYKKHAHETPSKRQEYMLRGLVRCSNCGSTLIYTAGGLQCHAYAKGVCQQSHYISMAQANARVIELIEQAFDRCDFVLEIRSKSNDNGSEKLIESQIQRERQKLERVRAAYEEGIDTLEEYKEHKSKILASIAALEDRKPAPAPKKHVLMRDFVAAHQDALRDIKDSTISEEDKNTLLRSFVDRIVFSRKKNQFQIFFYI